MRRKTKNVILAVIVSVAATFIPAAILGKWIEAIVFYICHWLIREQFPKQYHHIVHAICRVITGATLFFGISFVLPLSLSLFSAIPINYFIGWVGFTKKQADYYEVKYERLRKQIEEKRCFSADNCTLEQLLERCQEIGISEENTNLAIEFFIKKTKQSEIAKLLCVEEHAVTTRKLRLKKKLNKN
jgi:hypothetical protein